MWVYGGPTLSDVRLGFISIGGRIFGELVVFVVSGCRGQRHQFPKLSTLD